VSQKRKVSEGDNMEENFSSAKVSRTEFVSEDEQVELALLESKLTKVSTLCGKLYTNVQQQQLDVDDPIRVFLSKIVEAVKVTNEAQIEILEFVRKNSKKQETQIRTGVTPRGMSRRKVTSRTCNKVTPM